MTPPNSPCDQSPLSPGVPLRKDPHRVYQNPIFCLFVCLFVWINPVGLSLGTPKHSTYPNKGICPKFCLSVCTLPWPFCVAPGGLPCTSLGPVSNKSLYFNFPCSLLLNCRSQSGTLLHLTNVNLTKLNCIIVPFRSMSIRVRQTCVGLADLMPN